MKNFELKLQLFHETEKKFKELEEQKSILSKRQYITRRKEINKYAKHKIKIINKTHPWKKDIEKLIAQS